MAGDGQPPKPSPGWRPLLSAKPKLALPHTPHTPPSQLLKGADNESNKNRVPSLHLAPTWIPLNRPSGLPCTQKVLTCSLITPSGVSLGT